MEIKVTGEMTLAAVRQALFEKLHEIEDGFAVRFSRGATLYINPTDGRGADVVARRRSGEIIRKIVSRGPYRSAADEYNL